MKNKKNKTNPPNPKKVNFEVDKQNSMCYRIMFEDLMQDYYKVGETKNKEKCYLYETESKHMFLNPYRILEENWVADVNEKTLLINLKTANFSDYV